MVFKMFLALLTYTSCIASTNNEDSTSFVQRELASVSNLSNVTKLYQSTVSGNSTTATPAPTAEPPPFCRNGSENLEVTSKGVLFPYASKGKGSSCDSSQYCIGECDSTVYNADFSCAGDTCSKPIAQEKGCNLKTNIKAVFIDFDGTIELYDDLAAHVNAQLKTTLLKTTWDEAEWNESKKRDPQGLGLATHGKRIVGDDMIAALDIVFQGKGQTQFIKDYFDSVRLDTLKKALQFFKTKNVNLYVMSASWAPISAEAWAKYLVALTSDPKYGVNLKEHFTDILTVADPGGDTPGNKAVKIAEIMVTLGADMNAAVHIDNSYKYMQQVVCGDAMGSSVSGRGNAGGVNPPNEEGQAATATNNGVQCAHFAKIAEVQGWSDFVGIC